MSDDGRNWVLFNASPDLRAQIESFPAFQPARAVRDISIVGIILIDSQIDHATGLLMMREGQPLEIYCTDTVYQDLTTGFPVLGILEHYCGFNRHRIGIDATPFGIPGVEGLRFIATALQSKAPPYSPHRNAPHPGDNIGVRIEDARAGTSIFYAPGLGEIEPKVRAMMEMADCVLVDGTFWREDEMGIEGISHKRASEMGHLPQSGAGGMIEFLGQLKKPRKILIHINNTNPILDELSPERIELSRAGIEVAYDGMEIVL